MKISEVLVLGLGLLLTLVSGKQIQRTFFINMMNCVLNLEKFALLISEKNSICTYFKYVTVSRLVHMPKLLKLYQLPKLPKLIDILQSIEFWHLYYIVYLPKLIGKFLKNLSIFTKTG